MFIFPTKKQYIQFDDVHHNCHVRKSGIPKKLMHLYIAKNYLLKIYLQKTTFKKNLCI